MRHKKPKKLKKGSKAYKEALAKAMSMTLEESQVELARKMGGTVNTHGGVTPGLNYIPGKVY